MCKGRFIVVFSGVGRNFQLGGGGGGGLKYLANCLFNVVTFDAVAPGRDSYLRM